MARRLLPTFLTALFSSKHYQGYTFDLKTNPDAIERQFNQAKKDRENRLKFPSRKQRMKMKSKEE